MFCGGAVRTVGASCAEKAGRANAVNVINVSAKKSVNRKTVCFAKICRRALLRTGSFGIGEYAANAGLSASLWHRASLPGRCQQERHSATQGSATLDGFGIRRKADAEKIKTGSSVSERSLENSSV